MEFDKSRVYTAINAEELKIGSKCIFADTLGSIRTKVEGKEVQNFITTLKYVRNDGYYNRFYTDDNFFCFAYLIETPNNQKEKYKPFSSMENLKKAAVKCKGFIKTKQGVREGVIIGLSFDNEAIIKTRWGVSYSTFEQLFKSYIFDDGSPCGELAE